jgi:hypothetical protein
MKNSTDTDVHPTFSTRNTADHDSVILHFGLHFHYI